MKQPSGIFLANKPPGLSTNQLIQKIKHRLGIAKIGHAGTLDPLAEGLVVVLVNQATKLSSFLLTEKKRYTATLQLFTATTTGDREGEIVAVTPPRLITPSEIDSLNHKFDGRTYKQQPPIYSAIKIKGKKLYQYARDNEKITLPKRQVTIHDFKVKDYNAKDHKLKFATTVSKGTYIRSLGDDLAHELGTVGHLTQLVRNQSGNFKVDEAQKWEILSWDDLINLYDALILANYPIVIFKDSPQIVLNGQPISLPPTTPATIFLANEKKEILAYYRRGEDNLYHCLRSGFTN